MKRALVLSGGGARGAFQVGMLKELVVHRKLDFQILRGVSVGSLNAAFLAQAPSASDSQANLARKVEELETLWREKIRGNKSVYSRRLAGFVGLALGANSFYSLEPLRRLVEDSLDVELLQRSGRDFRAGTVSLVSGQYRDWSPENEPFLERFIASSSIPVLFPFIDLAERDVLVDGGVRNVTPMGSAFDAGADEIYVLLASKVERTEGNGLPPTAAEGHRYSQWKDNWLGTRVSGLDVLKRTIELLGDEILLEDLKVAIKWNQVAAAASKVLQAVGSDAAPEAVTQAAQELAASLATAERRPVPLKVIAPRKWFDEDGPEGEKNSAINFSPELIAKAITHGEEAAKDESRWLWPPA